MGLGEWPLNDPARARRFRKRIGEQERDRAGRWLPQRTRTSGRTTLSGLLDRPGAPQVDACRRGYPMGAVLLRERRSSGPEQADGLRRIIEAIVGSRNAALLLTPSMNEGPLSSPPCASAGRSVAARGGRPPAGTPAELQPEGVPANPRGRGWGSRLERCSSLYRFIKLRGPGVIGARSGGATQKWTVRQSGRKWRLPERRA